MASAHACRHGCGLLRPLHATIPSCKPACRMHERMHRAGRQSLSVVAAGGQIVATDEAPGAVGPYSQAVISGNTVYVSGQVGLVPGTKNFAGEDVEAQTEQVMKNLGAILKAAGSDYSKVIKTTVLLESMDDFAKVNAIYGRYLSSDPPARACFAVKTLPLNAKVEIEANAAV